jgi:hypothetical protein
MVTQLTAARKRDEAARGQLGGARVIAGSRRRGRPVVWGGGVALVAVGAAVAAAAVLSSGAKHQVLTIRRAVPAGRTITSADLGSVSISTTPGLASMPVTERASVVGSRAAVDLLPGTLVTSAEVTGTAIPAAGQSLVGVAFKPGMLPARALQRGDRVELITLPTTSGSAVTSGAAANSSTGTAGAREPAASVSRVAVVDAEGAAAQDGTVIVDVVVPADEAAGVVADGTGGRLSLVLLPRSTS